MPIISIPFAFRCATAIAIILLGSFSIAIILIDKRGLWGLIRRVLPADLIPIAHKPSAAFEPAPKPDPKALSFEAWTRGVGKPHS
jgi:hypothetical protein